MSTVEARRAILKAEFHRLEQYLRTLSPEAWQHPSVGAMRRPSSCSRMDGSARPRHAPQAY